MKDIELTAGKPTRHTIIMEERGEEPATGVGEIFQKAHDHAHGDEFAKGLEALGKQVQKKAQEDIARKKKQEEERKKEEEKRVRQELEKAKAGKDTSVDQEKELKTLISPLSQEEQGKYLQRWKQLSDESERSSLLNSLKAPRGKTEEVEVPEDKQKSQISLIQDERSYALFNRHVVTPEIEALEKEMIHHLREKGADPEEIEKLQRQIRIAVANEEEKIQEKIKKGDWKDVQKHLVLILHDIDETKKGLEEEEKLKEEVTDKKPEIVAQDAQKTREVFIEEARKKLEEVKREAEDQSQDRDKPEKETEPKGKLGVAPEVVHAHASLNDEDRIRKAEEVLGLGKGSLEDKKDAILSAHYTGTKGSSVYNYSVPELRQKYEILQKAGFNRDQIRAMMEYGITGVLEATDKYALAGISPEKNNGFEHFPPGSEKDIVAGAERYISDISKLKRSNDPWHPDVLMEANLKNVEREAGRTLMDDVNNWTEASEYYDTGFDSATSYLRSGLSDQNTFNIKGFNRNLMDEAQRLFALSQRVPSHLESRINASIGKYRETLPLLMQYQNQVSAVEREIETLKIAYSESDGSRDVQNKINDAERRLKEITTRFKNTVSPLLNHLDTTHNALIASGDIAESEIPADRESIAPGVPVGPPEAPGGGGDGGRPGGGGPGGRGPEGGAPTGRRPEGRGPGGGEGEPPIPPAEFGFRGRGEAEAAEEDPFGRSVRSIEDLGHFMELVTAEYRGKIMAALYRADDGTIVTEEKLAEITKSNEDLEAKKAESRLYAYKLGQGEYAMDYENTKVPPEYARRVQTNERGKRVLMLTAQEIGEVERMVAAENNIDLEAITQKYLRNPITLTSEERRIFNEYKLIDPSTGRPWSKPRGQNPTNYWEAVRIVKTDQFMNWIRSYWTLIHSDDPDNPVNFFTEIIVNHPDQRGAVPAGRMHKDAGTFLRSRFLTDPATGELRVYQKLREQIINEVWVPGGVRNKEVLYKKIMHADEKLPEVMRDQITADNLAAKTAAGGKNTYHMLFSLPEQFHENFDEITGEPIPETKQVEDVRFGSAVLLAYEMYYNISDIEGMKKLLGENASFFTRDAVTRAVLELKGILAPENLNDQAILADGSIANYNYYEAARRVLAKADDMDTVIDENLYANGRVNDRNPKALKKWLQYMNPFFPVQKDTEMLNVIRKVVENQMREIIGIEKGASASELAELHAYLHTYHDGIAARHDTGMGNRNSQSKYEFLGAPGGYQDKQFKRDRAGNLYNKGIVWRSIVGVLNGMPTRGGETMHDILNSATTIHLDALAPYRNILEQARKGEIAEVDIASIRQRIKSRTNFEDNPQVKEIIDKISEIEAKNGKLENLKERLENERESVNMKNVVGASYQIRELEKQAEELLLRSTYQPLNDAWEVYKNNEQKIFKRVNSVLGRLEFDEVQYTQYGGMHYSNGSSLFHLEMNSQDLPLDKLSGRDYQGRVFFKSEDFGPWLEDMEKRMRYTIETWQLPLGSIERRLINPRSSEPPKYVDLPIIETIFGSYDYTGARNGGVMKMAEMMMLRDVAKSLPEINAKRKEKGEPELTLQDFQFTDGNGNIASVTPKRKENGEIELDSLGNPIMVPTYDSAEAEARREKLRKIVGYLQYHDENNNLLEAPQKVDALVDDPASYFTKAYVKVRIANFIMSHTSKQSPYNLWTVQQREDFFRALRFANYFTEQDINDIRAFCDNGYWKNVWREGSRETARGFISGSFDAFKTFFKGVFSS